MALVLETRNADGTTARTALLPGRNRIPLDSGSSYRIFDDSGALAGKDFTIRRVDNDLVVQHLRASGARDETSVELPEYYTHCSSSNSCQVTIESAGAKPVTVSAASEPIGALADGSFILHDPGYEPSSLAGAGEIVPIRPILYGVGGLIDGRQQQRRTARARQHAEGHLAALRQLSPARHQRRG
jgi:hypothetical protein